MLCRLQSESVGLVEPGSRSERLGEARQGRHWQVLAGLADHVRVWDRDY